MLAGQALSLYRRRFVPLVLTAALALVPANALVGGAWVLGLAAKTTQEAAPPADAAEPAASPADKLDPAKAPDAHKPEASVDDSFHLRAGLAGPLLLSLLLASCVLLAASLLALAALVPLVLGAAESPAQAWSAVAARAGPLFRTLLLVVALTVAGACLCVLPGAVLAVGFAFAMPVVMVEGLRGRKALERAWVLMRAEWPALVAVLALYLMVAVLGSLAAQALLGPGLRQLAGAAALRVLLLPLALVWLVLLYLRARAAVDGVPEAGLRDQYIRRISAPG